MTENWTKYETELLRTELSNVDIADLTGRTLKAVRDKRYKVTGHYVEEDKHREKTMYEVNVMPALSNAEKEVRVLKLAQVMRVKLLG